MDALNIKLSPHDAVVLASFHQEWMPDMEGDEQFASLKVAMNNYFEAIVAAMPPGGLEDADAEVEVNILLGRSPERPEKK